MIRHSASTETDFQRGFFSYLFFWTVHVLFGWVYKFREIPTLPLSTFSTFFLVSLPSTLRHECTWPWVLRKRTRQDTFEMKKFLRRKRDFFRKKCINFWDEKACHHAWFWIRDVKACPCPRSTIYFLNIFGLFKVRPPALKLKFGVFTLFWNWFFSVVRYAPVLDRYISSVTDFFFVKLNLKYRDSISILIWTLIEPFEITFPPVFFACWS